MVKRAILLLFSFVVSLTSAAGKGLRFSFFATEGTDCTQKKQCTVCAFCGKIGFE
jgi:hypothetical protein